MAPRPTVPPSPTMPASPTRSPTRTPTPAPSSTGTPANSPTPSAIPTECVVQTLGETASAALAATWLKNLELPIAEESHLGAMEAFGFDLDGPAKEFIRSNGAAAFYANTALLSNQLDSLDCRYQNQASWLAGGGISHARSNLTTFPWGMIETSKGTFHWEIADLMVMRAQEKKLSMVGLILPFADWDQAGNPAMPSECTEVLAASFYWLIGGHYGPVGNLDDYRNFVSALAERYDGDGVDDMPGLAGPIKFWEVNNEPEATCGGYGGHVAEYVSLLEATHDTVTAHIPNAVILNGGALEASGPDVEQFWQDVFTLGGNAYFDVMNIHYNREKMVQAFSTLDNYRQVVDFFRGLMTDAGDMKPIWITEFGTYSGSPTTQSGDTLPEQSEEFQAGWFVRNEVDGFARGVDKFFPDLWGGAPPGGTLDPISAGRLIDGNRNVRLYFYTQKLLQHKVGAFDSAAEIADGQYRIVTGGNTLYVLWGSGAALPAEITGQIVVTDVYGNEQTMDASALTLTDSPVFVEPAAAPTPTSSPSPSASTTATQTPAPTETATSTPTETETPAPTETATPAPSETETPAPTESETPAPSPTETATPAPSETATPAPTETETPAPSESPTPEPSATPTLEPTAEPTETATPAPSESATPAPSPTETTTPAPSETVTPAPTETATPAPSATVSPSISPSATPPSSPTPTDFPGTDIPSMTPTIPPTPIPSSSPSVSPSPAESPTPQFSPTPSLSPSPSATFPPTPTAQESPTPGPTATEPVVTTTATATPTVQPRLDSDGDGYSDLTELRLGTNPYRSDSHPLLGDINGDGAETIADAVLYLRIVRGLVVMPGATLPDLDGDGIGGTEDDALTLYRWLIGAEGYEVLPIN